MKKDLFKLLAIGVVLFGAGFFLKSVGIAEIAAEPSKTVHLTFTAKDGLILHAWKSDATSNTSKGKKLPGLAILMPMMSRTYESYDPFRNRLNEIGYSTLAFDMRGNGLSTGIGKETVDYSSMDKTEFAKMPGDVESSFLDFMAKNSGKYDYDDVIVIGASIGANTAGLLLNEDWVARAVLLSPGRDYRGLQPETVMMGDFKGDRKPIYIAATEDDSYSVESSQWLFERYEGPKIFKKYPGKDHGTNILHNVKDADNELLDWLKQ
jgi:pimeloyl-ACP methyl ester carboxylesterase